MANNWKGPYSAIVNRYSPVSFSNANEMTLSEFVYCVTAIFKITEQVDFSHFSFHEKKKEKKKLFTNLKPLSKKTVFMIKANSILEDPYWIFFSNQTLFGYLMANSAWGT